LKPFSKEVDEKAHHVNLVQYLLSIGEPLIKDGSEYRLKRHDSLTINPDTNKWCWNSREAGGKNAIDYLMIVENMSYVDAVAALVGKLALEPQLIDVNNHSPPEKKDFYLPKPADDNRRVFAYLHRERCILPAVINHFIKSGDLYEDAEHHNAVFVGRDENDIPRYGHKRSTLTLFSAAKEGDKKNNTRWDVTGSDKRYGFKFVGLSDRLFIFEAPIDLLSFITLREMTQPPGTWKNDSYLAIGGVKNKALAHMLAGKGGERITRLVFCLDNDEAGQAAEQNYRLTYGEKYRVKFKLPAAGKDFNEMLNAVVKKGAVALLHSNK
jgi:hypothetical protein